ncbi:DUF3298 domain-containing protein [Thomasclavelia ramosa]
MKKRFLIFLLIIAPLCINAVHASEDNAKLQLLKEKHYETEGTIVTVKIPHVVNVKDDKVTKVINKLITQAIDDFTNEFKEFDKEPNTEHKLIADITFQNYYSDDKIISFSINATQIMADSYLQKKFYTVDLKTGEVYNIEHFLGSDYQNIVKKSVQQQIAENKEKYPNLMYFDEAVNNLKITNEQPFYINKDNQAVVVFNQFEIAPGYMSLPEFIIK